MKTTLKKLTLILFLTFCAQYVSAQSFTSPQNASQFKSGDNLKLTWSLYDTSWPEATDKIALTFYLTGYNGLETVESQVIHSTELTDYTDGDDDGATIPGFTIFGIPCQYAGTIVVQMDQYWRVREGVYQKHGTTQLLTVIVLPKTVPPIAFADFICNPGNSDAEVAIPKKVDPAYQIRWYDHPLADNPIFEGDVLKMRLDEGVHTFYISNRFGCSESFPRVPVEVVVGPNLNSAVPSTDRYVIADPIGSIPCTVPSTYYPLSFSLLDKLLNSINSKLEGINADNDTIKISKTFTPYLAWTPQGTIDDDTNIEKACYSTLIAENVSSKLYTQNLHVGYKAKIDRNGQYDTNIGEDCTIPVQKVLIKKFPKVIGPIKIPCEQAYQRVVNAIPDPLCDYTDFKIATSESKFLTLGPENIYGDEETKARLKYEWSPKENLSDPYSLNPTIAVDKLSTLVSKYKLTIINTSATALDSTEYYCTTIIKCVETLGNNTLSRIGNNDNSLTMISNDVSYILYPNPVSNSVTIERSISENSEIKLVFFNSLGQVVSTSSILPNEVTSQLDVSTFPKGIYFVNIINNGQTINRSKLIVQ